LGGDSTFEGLLLLLMHIYAPFEGRSVETTDRPSSHLQGGSLAIREDRDASLAGAVYATQGSFGGQVGDGSDMVAGALFLTSGAIAGEVKGVGVEAADRVLRAAGADDAIVAIAEGDGSGAQGLSLGGRASTPGPWGCWLPVLPWPYLAVRFFRVRQGFKPIRWGRVCA
jgi:hypothetical protein